MSGVFTVTESGAFGAIYAFLVTLLVYRSITIENFRIAVISAVRTTSMVMILIACAGAFAYMLTFYRVPALTVEFMTGLTENPIMILLMINLVLLLLGMIMDMAALILICTPNHQTLPHRMTQNSSWTTKAQPSYMKQSCMPILTLALIDTIALQGWVQVVLLKCLRYVGTSHSKLGVSS